MNPYSSLPPTAFWKTAVASHNMFDIAELWDPKFDIRPRQPVVTYGSCFAQHIGRGLAARGYRWLVAERAPHGLSPENRKLFNYDMFSARTGNIYTTSLLKQWTAWATNSETPPDEIWTKGGRFYDPFRPRIEPNGFESEEELRKSRDETLLALRRSIVRAHYFVFTLGLTESWINEEGGYEYPMCPGTAGGEFDPKIHRFVNQPYDVILRNMQDAMAMMRELNPTLRFILTVSPVPLTATMSSSHVLVATMHSKSLLRAVAGQLAQGADVDYFPSYEIVNSPPFRGAFFEPNQRDVNAVGVNFVMDSFFDCLKRKYGLRGPAARNSGESKRGEMIRAEIEAFFGQPGARQAGQTRPLDMEVKCEEELLASFGGKQ